MAPNYFFNSGLIEMYILATRNLSFILFIMCCVSTAYSYAEEQFITEELYINGNENGLIVSPFSIPSINHNSNTKEYALYDIDYEELKRQISIYKRIYFTGQLLHGTLMIKMKPKFVDK